MTLIIAQHILLLFDHRRQIYTSMDLCSFAQALSLYYHIASVAAVVPENPNNALPPNLLEENMPALMWLLDRYSFLPGKFVIVFVGIVDSD